MGGQLFGSKVRRYDTDEFEKLKIHLTPILKDMFNTEIVYGTYYRTKLSHGDLDVLLLNNGKLGNIQEKLTSITNDIHSNGNVISFVYRDFQVDLILLPEGSLETGLMYFSNDPIHNILGKIAHKFGLKHSDDGLIYPYRSKTDSIMENIVISKEPRKIMEFLGCDYDKYLGGFETLEEIFEYIIHTKYFNFDIFDLKKLYGRDRKRNKKRKSYNEFLNYIHNYQNKKNNFEFYENKNEYLSLIDKSFPVVNFISKLDKLKEKEVINDIIQNKFNGKLIMKKYPELKGKQLGNIITNFKNNFDNFNEFILNSDEELIFKEFNNFL
jgi:hypothetical protein